MKRRINSIGIYLGDSGFCVSVFGAGCPIYLHGTTDDIRAFGSEIIDAADAYDLAQLRAAQDAAAVPEPASEATADSEMARVCWRNPSIGSNGHGSALPIAIAKDALCHASDLHPNLKHWLELVDPATEPDLPL